VTAITLLAIKVDSPPDQLRLDPTHGLILRLEAGVHLDLSDASEETCQAMAELLATAAQIKAVRRLPEVA
jgi:ferritin-like metal-binding protein YciE